MTDTETDLIHFIGRVQPVSILEVATELDSLARCGASWPVASVQNWSRLIEGLVSTGKLTLENELVRVATEAARPKQMTLFD